MDSTLNYPLSNKHNSALSKEIKLLFYIIKPSQLFGQKIDIFFH